MIVNTPTTTLVSEAVPLHDTPILGMTSRPYIESPTVYGGTLDVEGAAGFWVEYTNGLMDLTRSHWIHSTGGAQSNGTMPANEGSSKDEEPPALDAETQVEIEVKGEPKRTIRVCKDKCALVVIDMQKYVPRAIEWRA
jgi:hypothetical protein